MKRFLIFTSVLLIFLNFTSCIDEEYIDQDYIFTKNKTYTLLEGIKKRDSAIIKSTFSKTFKERISIDDEIEEMLLKLPSDLELKDYQGTSYTEKEFNYGKCIKKTYDNVVFTRINDEGKTEYFHLYYEICIQNDYDSKKTGFNKLIFTDGIFEGCRNKELADNKFTTSYTDKFIYPGMEEKNGIFFCLGQTELPENYSEVKLVDGNVLLWNSSCKEILKAEAENFLKQNTSREAFTERFGNAGAEFFIKFYWPLTDGTFIRMECYSETDKIDYWSFCK